MLEGKRVAVVVPAYNEELLIADTVAGMPPLVDRVYVVDDRSKDATAERARAIDDPRIEVIVRERNEGVGAAIVTGYKRAIGERSGIRLRKVVPRISWLLLKGFFWRMGQKYVIRDFHPLVFFYALGFLMSILGLALGIAEVVLRVMGNQITAATVVLVALLLIFGSHFTLFAMWVDLEACKDLR